MSDKVRNIVMCVSFSLAVGVFALLCWVLPKEEFNFMERREPKPMPGLSVESVLGGSFMSEFEAYTTDNFPLRKEFRALKAGTSKYVFQKLDNNGVYMWDGYISSMEYPMNPEELEYAGKRFSYINNKYLSEANNVYFSLIPDKNAFMAEESGHLSMDYDAFADKMAECVPFAQYIDIYPLLSLEDYYKTDTHWRQESITDVAAHLLSAMGATADEAYTEETLTEDFRGVYYGQYALPVDGEKIVALSNAAISSATVYDHQNQREIPVYNKELSDSKDPYEVYLSGSLSYVQLNNPLSNNGKRLIIFRDSFTSSLAPLLLSGYDEVHLLDIRYQMSDALCPRVDFKDADVLFLYSAQVLNTASDTIK